MASLLLRRSALLYSRIIVSPLRCIPYVGRGDRIHRLPLSVLCLHSDAVSSGGGWLFALVDEKKPFNKSIDSNSRKILVPIALSPRPSLLRRLASTLRRWWDGVWVIFRGTEIVVRLAPLMVMAPISYFSPLVSDWTWSTYYFD